MGAQPAGHQTACSQTTPAFQGNGQKPCDAGYAMGLRADITMDEINAATAEMCLEHQVCFMRHLVQALRIARLEADIRDLHAQIEQLKHA